jgi:hypothetical protein
MLFKILKSNAVLMFTFYTLNANACDYNSDKTKTLLISNKSNVSSCSNININEEVTTKTKRGLYLINVNNADNHGNISINTKSEKSVYGIHSTAADSSLENYASIDIKSNENSNNKYSVTYGIMLPNGEDIHNEGNISIESQGINYGIRANKFNSLDNSGIIDTTSRKNKTYGIRAVTFNSIYNNADITTSGVSSSAIHLKTGDYFENNADINVNTTKVAEAINANNVRELHNNANITTNSSDSSSISLRLKKIDEFINNSDITSKAIKAIAQGVNLSNSNTFINNGTIDANSQNKVSTAVYLKNVTNFINEDTVTSKSNSQYSYGINSFNTKKNATHSIINNGEINSHSNKRTSYGISVGGNTDITNNASINVTNSKTSGYGILFKNSKAKLKNNNLINAKTAQVNATNNSTINVGSYAMQFNGSQEILNKTYEGTLRHDSSSKYVFNKTKLNVYLGDNYKNKSLYEIPTLTKNSTSNKLGDSSNQFENVVGITNPDYDYKLINGKKDEKQKLRISFKPKSSNTQSSLKVNANLSKNKVKSIKSDLKRMIIPNIKPTQSTAPAKTQTVNTGNLNFTSSGFDETVQGLLSLQDPKSRQSIINKINNSFSFIMPYYSTTTDSSNYGYEADMTGVVTGINYLLENGVLAGFHIGYGSSDIEYTGEGYETKTEESKNYSIGVQAAKTVNNFILSAVSSLTFLRNNYHDASSTNTEHAKYSATSLNSSFEVGYIKKLADFTIIPKLGLSHYWFKSNEYEIENLQNPNSVVGRINESNIAANIGAEVYSTHTVDDLTIRPNFNFNIEQILTDNNLNNTITAGQTTQTVSSSADSTTYTFGSNVAFEKGKNTTTVGFNSSMSDNIRNNTLFIEYKRKF